MQFAASWEKSGLQLRATKMKQRGQTKKGAENQCPMEGTGNVCGRGLAAFRTAEGRTIKSSFDTYLIKIWIFFSIWFSFFLILLRFGTTHIQLWSWILHHLNANKETRWSDPCRAGYGWCCGFINGGIIDLAEDGDSRAVSCALLTC